MHDRAKLTTLARLIAVQRARRAGAEAALVDARRDEAEARRTETARLGEVEAASLAWKDCLDRPGFTPELSHYFSSRLIASDAAARRAGVMAETAGGATSRREEEWQRLEAQVRSAGEAHRRLTRKAARRLEEGRLDSAADRVTQKWSRS